MMHGISQEFRVAAELSKALASGSLLAVHRQAIESKSFGVYTSLRKHIVEKEKCCTILSGFARHKLYLGIGSPVVLIIPEPRDTITGDLAYTACFSRWLEQYKEQK
jgi:hypothetical protein